MKKLIVAVSINVIILLLGVFFALSILRQPANKTDEIVVTPAKKATIEDIDINQLLHGTNEYRLSQGLRPLAINQSLNQSAQDKCNDMVTRDYWSHYTPEGQEPWVFVSKYTTYKSAGENQAFGYANAKEVLDGWIISPTHNENLLRANFTDVGFGVCLSESFVGNGLQVIVVQHFISV